MAIKLPTILLLSCLISTLSAQTLSHMAISQVVSTPPTLRSYLDVQNAENARVSNLPANGVEAWLDGKPLSIRSVEPFSASQEGVGFVLLVDISESESRAEFAKVQHALQGFIGQMGNNDRAAVISFGSEVRDVSEFTGDKAALKSSVSGLVNNATMTHLNGAISEGLHLARISKPGLPLRRCIIILSDGKDEGSGLTTEDVLNKFEDGRIPIYAIGASSLPAPQEAKYLEVLHRYAVLSGGAYYDATPDTASTAYSLIQKRIGGVSVADFDCSSCVIDGRSHPFEVRVTLQGQSLTDKTDVILLGPVADKEENHPSNQFQQYFDRLTWPACVGSGVPIALLIAGLIWVVRRKKSTRIQGAEHLNESSEGGSTPDFVPYSFPNADSGPTEPFESVPPADARPGLKIELIRKQTRNGVASKYSGKLVDNLLIGRSPEAAIHIPDGEISGRHCRLDLVNDLVLLSDAGSTFGTTINGVPISTRHKVESGDLIAFGKVEFRINIQR